jgi:hypothetical protein
MKTPRLNHQSGRFGCPTIHWRIVNPTNEQFNSEITASEFQAFSIQLEKPTSTKGIY